MFARLVQRMLLTSIAAAGLVACDSGVLSTSRGYLECLFDLASISHAIARTAGYPENDVEVMGNRTHLQITLIHAKLESADSATLEKAATALVAAAEQALVARKGCASVQVISVAIYHPSERGARMSEWHLEDVVEFRRGSDQRFSVYVP